MSQTGASSEDLTWGPTSWQEKFERKAGRAGKQRQVGIAGGGSHDALVARNLAEHSL